jgi:hypothetical protein
MHHTAWPKSGSVGAVRYRCCQHSARFSGELVLKNDSLVIVQWLVPRQTVFLCNLENEEILFSHFTTAEHLYLLVPIPYYHLSFHCLIVYL